MKLQDKLSFVEIKFKCFFK